MNSRINATILFGSIVASLSFAAPDLFAGSGNYKSITTRNPFGLSPPIPPKTPTPISPVTLPV